MLQDELKKGNEHLLEKVSDFLAKTLGDNDFEIVAWVPILQQGWEMDEWALLIKVAGGRKVLLHTDHASLYQVENPKAFLQEKVELCQVAITQCELAKSQL